MGVDSRVSKHILHSRLVLKSLTYSGRRGDKSTANSPDWKKETSENKRKVDMIDNFLIITCCHKYWLVLLLLPLRPPGKTTYCMNRLLVNTELHNFQIINHKARG